MERAKRVFFLLIFYLHYVSYCIHYVEYPRPTDMKTEQNIHAYSSIYMIQIQKRNWLLWLCEFGNSDQESDHPIRFNPGTGLKNLPKVI